MRGIKNKIETNYNKETIITITDFCVKLFQHTISKNKNVVISPLSLLAALTMTANGAKGETLAQIEQAFQLPISKLTKYLHTYQKTLPIEEKYKLSMANVVWFKDDKDFNINQDFLHKTTDYFGASFYQAPFDSSTLGDINKWVEKHTQGMISNILNKILPDAVIYLINAVAFEAEWNEIYKKNQVYHNKFTKEDGTVQDVELMYSTEFHYLKEEHAEGFLKYYANRKYAFAALLPNDSITVCEYIASLTGEKLYKILTNPMKMTEIKAAIPKYKTEYSIEMSKVLQKMGIKDAFDMTRADFSGIGSHKKGNLFMNRVIHKTLITVNTKGTKAGTATVVEECLRGAIPSKTIYLNRPFVYFIFDCEKKLPIFFGTVMEIE